MKRIRIQKSKSKRVTRARAAGTSVRDAVESAIGLAKRKGSLWDGAQLVDSDRYSRWEDSVDDAIRCKK